MNDYYVWMMKHSGSIVQKDVIKVNLDEGETQVIEVNGEERIVISKDCNGNTTIKTQHKEFCWVDDCNKQQSKHKQPSKAEIARWCWEDCEAMLPEYAKKLAEVISDLENQGKLKSN